MQAREPTAFRICRRKSLSSGAEVAERAVKLMHLPEAVTDRARTPAVTIPGSAGTARARTRQIGDVRLRTVDYAPGYVADRWCAKGHVVLRRRR